VSVAVGAALLVAVAPSSDPAELLASVGLDAPTAAWIAGLVALAFLLWALSLRRRLRDRLDDERAIRRDAIERSGAAIRGRVSETFAPYLPGWEFEPGDCRFLGTPVDFVVFDGLHAGRCDRVVLVEVKSGSAMPSPLQRRVRDAAIEGRVEWREVRIE
jgi:predicted Holliday junction resolvase-like endonuclease